jgi:hypothetical protein
VDRVAGPLVLQVPLQHRRQRLLATQLRFKGGQGPALPDGAGLAGGRPRLDHGQQPASLLGLDPGLLQPVAGDRQQPPDQLGRQDRPHPAARAEWPGQLGAEAELGGAVEIVVGLPERDLAHPGIGVGGQGPR